MCLTAKWYSRPKTAKEDIICYKYLEESYFKESLVTPYMNWPIVIGETYTATFGITKKGFFGKVVINAGLHSFVNLKDVKDEGSYGSILVKCIIPKGAKYYFGKFKYVLDTYASDKLTYVEIIK